MGMVIVPTGGGAGGVDPDELTATAKDVLKGKIAGVKGSDEPVMGTMEVQSILSFSVAPTSATQITCTWKNPAKGPFSGVIIIGKTGSYPTSVTDGTRHYKGSGNNTNANGYSVQIISKLNPATKYYFRAFSYAIKNGAEWIAGSSRTAETATPVAKGTQNFTSSGTFIVPDGVTKIDVFCVGGGGGGGATQYFDQNTKQLGGGGGGGRTVTKKSISVTPGSNYTVTIGAGGYGGNAGSSSTRTAGGNTMFGTLVIAEGGGTPDVGSNNQGSMSDYSNGAHGGSGGGGSYGLTYSAGGPGKGGSDGSDGQYSELYMYVNPSYRAYGGGSGQGTTTRAFGESSGTLYAGGGGGAWPNYGKVREDSTYTGAGGAGGGGAGGKTLAEGYNNNPQGRDGSSNTGGGGGGSTMQERFGNAQTAGSHGGTGICLIRWGY